MKWQIMVEEALNAIKKLECLDAPTELFKIEAAKIQLEQEVDRVFDNLSADCDPESKEVDESFANWTTESEL